MSDFKDDILQGRVALVTGGATGIGKEISRTLGKHGAKIVITNYHGFKRRERIELSKGGRSLLQGRGAPLETVETETPARPAISFMVTGRFFCFNVPPEKSQISY